MPADEAPEGMRLRPSPASRLLSALLVFGFVNQGYVLISWRIPSALVASIVCLEIAIAVRTLNSSARLRTGSWQVVSLGVRRRIETQRPVESVEVVSLLGGNYYCLGIRGTRGVIRIWSTLFLTQHRAQAAVPPFATPANRE